MAEPGERAIAGERAAMGARDDSAPRHPAWPPPHGTRARAARRQLRADGRRTRRRLLDAGRTALARQGFHTLRVDDVVHAAGTSHGTFYLYFASKEDLLGVLIGDALSDMEAVVSAFPAVPEGEYGRQELHTWIRRFCDTYAAHAIPLRLLSQAEASDEKIRSCGLRLLWQLTEAITQGMTNSETPGEHAEFTALACAMMLERMNYLLSIGITMPKREMEERVTAIMSAAFSSRIEAVTVRRSDIIRPVLG